MGYDRKKVHVVLNRADSRVGITAEDVAAVLGHAPDVLLPSDREVPRALNEGVPIVMARRQSAVTRAFKQLAASMEQKTASASAITTTESGKQPRRSLLGRKA
jgi:MinD-like ATPase involved in chromosome partitioning or flagellar assembly